jgi:hypothetical protein
MKMAIPAKHLFAYKNAALNVGSGSGDTDVLGVGDPLSLRGGDVVGGDPEVDAVG